MKIKTCFDILAIPEDACLDEAKQSYKKLVKRWHPDQYGNDPEKQRIAQEKLKEINIAYRELVTHLKNTTGSPVTASETNTAKRKTQTREAGKSPKTSIFDRAASFFKTRFNTPDGTDDRETGGQPGASQKSNEKTHDLFERDRPVSDFSQVLKRAIRNHPRSAAGQRLEIRAGKAGRRRMHRPKGRDIVSKTSPQPHRQGGERVEKISPIRPVGKIGE